MNETKPNINVTPLIDILLVLLILFMVISPLRPHDFKTKIPSEPKPENAAATPHPHTLIITVNPDSSLKLNQIELASIAEPAPLTQKLAELFRERENNLVDEKTVFIKAPKGLPYGEVVKVVDAVKMSGAAPIGLQIDGLIN